MIRVHNRVLLLLLAIGLAAAFGLAFVAHAPNRLVPGTGISLFAVVASQQGVVLAWTLIATLAPALLLLVAAFLPRRAWLSATCALASSVLLLALVWLAANHAQLLAQPLTGASPDLSPGIGRTSFGGAFWILAALVWLAAADAIASLGLPPAVRLLATTAVVAPIAVCMASGLTAELSLFREYANRQDVFNAALLQHVHIVLASLLPSLLIGVPLGIASLHEGERMQAFKPYLFGSLNLVQTIPSVALFGLLMVPLALLARAVPVLSDWGVHGIGMAPAVVALSLYSLLPIIRSTAAGLGQVPEAVVTAALGMGMRPAQIFWQVKVPLALPALLSGLRVATVQTIGLAMVAALIGAGGFGAIMFQGLQGGALDLVLLGVAPVVLMAVVVDAVLTAVAAALTPKARP